MALVVDANPLSITNNSYVSLADMLTYVSTRVSDTDAVTQWQGLTSAQQSMLLVNASRSLDSYAEWKGYKYSRDQGLKWPRYDVWVEGFIVDNTTFPQPVIDATCEMALWLMQTNGDILQAQNAEFSSVKVGPINIKFNQQVAGAKDKYFPDIVVVLLKDYGMLSNPILPGGLQARSIRIERA